MVLSHVPRKLIRNALRIWQDILDSNTKHGVFIVHGELKIVAVKNAEVQATLDQMVDDIPEFFVGLFDQRGDYQQFLSDVAATANQLAMRNKDDG